MWRNSQIVFIHLFIYKQELNVCFYVFTFLLAGESAEDASSLLTDLLTFNWSEDSLMVLSVSTHTDTLRFTHWIFKCQWNNNWFSFIIFIMAQFISSESNKDETICRNQPDSVYSSICWRQRSKDAHLQSWDQINKSIKSHWIQLIIHYWFYCLHYWWVQLHSRSSDVIRNTLWSAINLKK